VRFWQNWANLTEGVLSLHFGSRLQSGAGAWGELGCGAGDLLVKTGGSNREVYEFPKVIRVASRLKMIEQWLKTRHVE